ALGPVGNPNEALGEWRHRPSDAELSSEKIVLAMHVAAVNSFVVCTDIGEDAHRTPYAVLASDGPAIETGIWRSLNRRAIGRASGCGKSGNELSDAYRSVKPGVATEDLNRGLVLGLRRDCQKRTHHRARRTENHRAQDRMNWKHNRPPK